MQSNDRGLADFFWNRFRWLFPALFAFGVLSGCEKDARGVRGPKAGEVPEEVPVAGGEIVSGFKSGQLRGRVELEAFRMARFPVSVGQYRACVNAGACRTPAAKVCPDQSPEPLSGQTYALGNDELPATCVGIQQARDYCSWAGGTLPTLEQWLSAARGFQPQRFPWGDTEADCDQHARGQPKVDPRELDPRAIDATRYSSADEFWEHARPTQQSCSDREDRLTRLSIGRHPAGQSESGIEDVLLTPGELVASTDGSLFMACTGSRAGCVVHGLTPGAIDSVEPISGASDPTRVAYGFRCVWKE